ncbi:MAG: hypothetical protein ACI8QZ_003509 [Chlamydiales bacterium]|jgi:hypothetical protein
MSIILTTLALGASLTGASTFTNSTSVPSPNDLRAPSAFFWGDFDGDGLADAYVVGDGPARLLRNLGDGRFTDVTDRTGLTLAGAGTRAHMAAWADYDGDGRLDLYLPARAGASHLLRQAADGTFEVATEYSGLPAGLNPSSAQWLDYDGDGQPDLRVVFEGIERLFHNVGAGLLEEIDLGVEPRPFLFREISAGVAPIDRAETPDATAAAKLGASGTGLPTNSAATSAAGPEPDQFCAPALRDVMTGDCLTASSIPTAGMLYPLGNEFFIDGGGFIGLSTMTPGAKLDVVGGDIRTDGQLVSTAGSGAPLSVASSDLVSNLNADQLDGFDAAAFSMLGNSIGTAEIENSAVDGNKLAANAVQSIHIFPNTINSLDIASGGVLSDEIGDSTILNVDVNPLAAIAGTKISPSFGTQTVLSSGTTVLPAAKGVSVNGPTTGFLGVQGTNDFDGVAAADWSGQEIGVAGISTGASNTDNYGVVGLSNHAGVRGQGDAFGVQGLTTVDTAIGVFGQNTSTNGLSYGVMGELPTGSSTGTAVYGVAPFYGVAGHAVDNGVAVLGTTTNSGVGVYGRGRDGVLGDSQVTSGNSTGVFGVSQSTSGEGVHGSANAATGTAIGVCGDSNSSGGRGVYGYTSSTTGVTYGVLGQAQSTSGRGVRGEALATTGTNYGVQGRTHSPNGWGIISYGSSGTTGQKSFIQPHPTDPTKEIHFFSLEGNESGTYFRGNDHIVRGRAVIEVPEEFRLVSIEDGMTVQLTPIGAPALLWIESRNLNQIIVRSSQDVEFDYTVNGVRRGFEQVTVMTENHSFVPESIDLPFGTEYPDSYRDIMVQSGILNPDYTPNEATAAQMGWQLTVPEGPRQRAEEIPALTRIRQQNVPSGPPVEIGRIEMD